MTVGITGASGFLGSAIAAAFDRDGFDVVALVRDPARLEATRGYVVRPYELGSVPDLSGIDWLVHCAFAVRGSGADDGVARNVDGTIALFEAARRMGIRFAFISSISADRAIDSAYSRQKCAIDDRLGREAFVLRPGLIAGDGGFFGSLLALAQRPFVPLIDGGRQSVQVIGVEDVYRALRAGMEHALTGPHNAVAEPPLPLREVIARMSRRRVAPRFVDVPFGLAFAVASIAERCGLRLPVTTENLRGLRGARVRAASEGLRALGWSPEDAPAVLDRCAAKGSS